MLYLHGIGHFYPENIITNPFLEELNIGTSEEWIMERVGIRTRRTVLPLDYIRNTKNRDPREAFAAGLYNNAQTGAAASRMALDRAGIKPEDIDRLFQPFRQLDSGLTRQYEGTGLGLSISRRLVELLGGTISVESRWGRGTMFQFTLPIQPEQKS